MKKILQIQNALFNTELLSPKELGNIIGGKKKHKHFNASIKYSDDFNQDNKDFLFFQSLVSDPSTVVEDDKRRQRPGGGTTTTSPNS